MNRILKITVLLLCAVLCIACAGCVSTQNDSGVPAGMTFNFQPTLTEYDQFYDLGNYLILLKENKNVDVSAAVAYVQNTKGPIVGGCSAIAKHDANGDVIIGRNMDLPATLYPAFIAINTFGKYKTMSVSYVGSFIKLMGSQTYEEILESGTIDEDLYNAIPFAAPGAFNEKGLYVAGDMRYGEPLLNNYGTNPDKQLADFMSLPTLVTANCATVKEALEFIKTEYSWTSRNIDSENPMDYWNLGFMMGDAEGNFGLVEIAGDTVKFIPYQPGHSNHYVSPIFASIAKSKEGSGRLQILFDNLMEPQTEEEMQAVMPKAYCSAYLLNIFHSYRDADGTIHFVDKDGNAAMDWRGEFLNTFGSGVPVDENGNMISETGYEEGFIAYCIAQLNGDTETMKKNESDYYKHKEYLDRCTNAAIYDDKNFETVQEYAILIDQLLGISDKLNKFYAGDEMPLRTDTSGSIWLAGETVGVNCAKKHINVMFWENPNVKVDLQW